MGGTEQIEMIISQMIDDLVSLGIHVDRDASTGTYTIRARGHETKVFGKLALGSFIEGVKFAQLMQSGEVHTWMDRSDA